MEGILIILAASLFNANFTLPMKYTKKWDWEHAWGMWALWACFILPVIVAYLSVPNLLNVYKDVPIGRLMLVFGASLMWGLSAIAFGIGVALTGIAIGFSVIMGLVITTGTLIPLVAVHPQSILTPTGLCIIAGLIAMMIGIVLCGKAGYEKDKHLVRKTDTAVDSKSFKRGIIMCILAGVFGPMINFSFIFGEPIKTNAINFGADPFWATNAIWCLTLFGGFVANSCYCAYLITKNRTWYKLFAPRTASHWGLGSLMGVFFMAGIVFYGVGASKIGVLGTSIGWALFQGPTIIIANLSGFLTGEWKDANSKAVKTMIKGVLAILVGIVIVAIGKII